MSEENIENTTKSGMNFASTFVDHHVLPDINFNVLCLINLYIPEKVKSICFLQINTDFTLNNCLFGSANATKICQFKAKDSEIKDYSR